MFFWVTFDGYKSGMVSGKGEAEAKSKAEEIAGAGVKTIDSLPYPALPKLHEFRKEGEPSVSIRVVKG